MMCSQLKRKVIMCVFPPDRPSPLGDLFNYLTRKEVEQQQTAARVEAENQALMQTREEIKAQLALLKAQTDALMRAMPKIKLSARPVSN